MISLFITLAFCFMVSIFLGFYVFTPVFITFFAEALVNSFVPTLSTIETFLEFILIFVLILKWILDYYLSGKAFYIVLISGIVIVVLFVGFLILGLINNPTINNIPIIGDIADRMYFLYHDIYDFFYNILKKICNKFNYI